MLSFGLALNCRLRLGERLCSCRGLRSRSCTCRFNLLKSFPQAPASPLPLQLDLLCCSRPLPFGLQLAFEIAQLRLRLGVYRCSCRGLRYRTCNSRLNTMKSLPSRYLLLCFCSSLELTPCSCLSPVRLQLGRGRLATSSHQGCSTARGPLGGCWTPQLCRCRGLRRSLGFLHGLPAARARP